MARIDLVSSGFIYRTAFDSVGAEWILSPDGGYFSILPEGFKMDPSSNPDGSVLALLSCRGLNYQYAVEAELDYSPVSLNDSAGLALWSSDEDAVYLSLAAGTDMIYDKLRFRVKDDRCEAYAFRSSRGEWEVVGTAFVSHDPLPAIYAEGSAPVIVREVVVVRDTLVSVGNIPNGYYVYLKNEEGGVIAVKASSGGAVEINLGSVGIAIKGQLEVCDSFGVVAASTGIIDIYGGDVFWYNTLDLKLFSDGVEVLPGDEVFLGGLMNGTVEKRLEIYNPGPEAVTNVSVYAANFNTAHGDKWVLLAPDVGGVPGYYDKSVHIPQIEAESYAAFWVKVQRPQDMLFFPFTDHRFSLVISTS